jgi:hypothetical protein
MRLSAADGVRVLVVSDTARGTSASHGDMMRRQKVVCVALNLFSFPMRAEAKSIRA